jgi:hypothetical protein
MLNPFFLQGSKAEQGLVQDLINESIQIHGIDVYYLPRQYVTEKTIIKEVIESEFSKAYPIEAYVNSYDGYDGQGTILSKFGIQELDDLSIIISKERFELYITPLIKKLSNVKLSTRPKEGDLIYFPLGDRLFEIKYVEHEKPFYQLRENYVYELRCELFRYGDETLNTGIDYIDDNVESEGYIQTLSMVGAASSATAIVSAVNGGVRFITVTNRGTGYTSAPNVNISLSPVAGGNASGIATMIGGIVDICEPDGTLLRVQGVEIVNSGFGYTESPKVVFVGGGGVGAEATAVIADGVVGIITITDGGSGYVDPPTITFNTPAFSLGETAKAIAILDNGSVTQIRIIDGGFGYSQPPIITDPTIIIDPPTFIANGIYITNEVVRGLTSNTTARVKSWNAITNELQVSNLTGSFLSGEIVVGNDSGAEFKLKSSIVPDSKDLSSSSSNLNNYNLNDPYAQNFDIQKEANQILDFSEKNPFGTP